MAEARRKTGAPDDVKVLQFGKLDAVVIPVMTAKPSLFPNWNPVGLLPFRKVTIRAKYRIDSATMAGYNAELNCLVLFIAPPDSAEAIGL